MLVRALVACQGSTSALQTTPAPAKEDRVEEVVGDIQDIIGKYVRSELLLSLLHARVRAAVDHENQLLAVGSSRIMSWCVITYLY